MKFYIPVNEQTLALCQFIHGGPIPLIQGEFFFLVNTDPGLTHPRASVPAKTVKEYPPAVILKVDEVIV